MKFFPFIATLLLAGSFYAQDGVSGTVDLTFNPNDMGALPDGIVNNEVSTSIVLSDQTILIGGAFTTVNGVSARVG